MKYTTIKAFTDKNKNSADEAGKKHIYWKGDKYPYKSYAGATTNARIQELLDTGLIEEA